MQWAVIIIRWSIISQSEEHQHTLYNVILYYNGNTCFTLIKEVDGLHAGIFLIADLQLMELTEQIDQLLHHLHPILTETTHTNNYRSSTWPHTYVNKIQFVLTALMWSEQYVDQIWTNMTAQSLQKIELKS